ncbi:MAG TPA: EAL domain-containing protein [Micromonosporaceae bacterium]
MSPHPTHSWSTSQLVEYLAVLSKQPDEECALQAAVERVIESLDAEIGIVFGHAPLTVVGLPAEDPHVATLMAEGTSRSPAPVPVAGVGLCRVATVALDVEDDALRLLVARAGAEDFTPDEMLLLRGMAWVLNLALRPLQVMRTLHERQRVLEQVTQVQHALASRDPLPEVFDTVTQGARELLDAEFATLYLAEDDELVVVSVSSSAHTNWPPPWASQVMRVKSGVGRLAYLTGELIRVDDYPACPIALQELVDNGASAAMAAPVRENGKVVGSLTVVSFRAGHAFTKSQEQALLTFADQVSMALSDAKTMAAAQSAMRDAVTGLPNRVLFVERLEQAVAAGTPIHVIFVDLDRFKLVNDTMGHAAGDDLLRQVGLRLRERLRPEDCLARFGGDEYAVLLENTPDAEACRIGEAMLAAVKESYVIGTEEVVVGGSIGIARAHGGTADAVLRDADTAMYRAKRAGGRRLVVFEQSMHTALVQRQNLEADLRRAIDDGALCVVFQPIVDLRQQRTYAAEALARWQHRRRGLVPPREFITLAEETGLIGALGRRIMETACAQATTWPAGPPHNRPPNVAVNVSARQMQDPSFLEDVRTVLADTGLAPHRLTLEITESTIVSDLEAVVDQLHRLRELGVTIAVDDFGTGYSSLAILRTIPVDILKIDRSFVEGVDDGWQGGAFVRTIVRLTETLSVTAVAEGVETRSQADALRRIGCPLGQGYLFAPPMRADDLALYLAGTRSRQASVEV